MFFNELQYKNAEQPIVSRPSLRVIASHPEHLKNAESPIEVTVPLISAEINISHLEKASDGISLIPLSIMTYFVTFLYLGVNSVESDTARFSFHYQTSETYGQRIWQKQKK